ncbi:hypothetical protein A9995_13950 [Erythrobacter sp. QSSC1-22B]|uniref:hypothetical protein n=1 Tax=Erythrobacter sp. QSSC1-22B TaxID=1860125 RepID=UPI000804E8A9|nr:hypothetical protein [Erythrobacter sp. QSSC1-22B]OBX18055.1 hypothetical protein A9995_13950 [Erythrobacter sp. QSSC1-22B]
MAVTIQPIPDSARLAVTGDLETVLMVPFEDDDRFFIGFSDGTLLQGTYDHNLRCGWKVAREGAGLVKFYGESVVLEGLVRWVSASVYDANVVEPQPPKALPLFPELDQQAA